MELLRLAPDVFACLQEDRGLGCSNSGLLLPGGGLVVDTFWDLAHTRRMIELYARVWQAPPRRVVNTHHNGDHCWGNQLFPEAEVIGHRLCAAAFGSERPELMQALRDGAAGADPALATLAKRLAGWDFRGIELRPPTRLVDERLELDLEGLRVELLYVGPAHTAGDLVVHLPERRIVFAGDVVFHRCTPLGWEGSSARWIEALDRLLALDPEVVVPGHGPVGGPECVRAMREYLHYVQGEALRLRERGFSPLEAAKRIELGPYAEWTEPERIYALVERAYREAEGKPYDAPIDRLAWLRGMDAVRREHPELAGRSPRDRAC